MARPVDDRDRYWLINTAVGGDLGGDVDPSIFPQKYYIDWVRIFEIK